MRTTVGRDARVDSGRPPDQARPDGPLASGPGDPVDAGTLDPVDPADTARLLAGHELLLAVAGELALAADGTAVTALARSAARRLTGADDATFIVREGRYTYRAQAHVPDAVEARLLQALAGSTHAALESWRRRRQLETVAEERAAEVAALTYAVSHDLRAPIRHLEGFARILLQDVADLGPAPRHGAQRIQDAATHLREMVNGMLTLSRIGQSEVHPQPLDLADLGREVAQDLAARPTPTTGPGRAGDVEFVVPGTLPVTGDARLLRALLQELLGNAWKFTARTPQPRVELGVRAGSSGPEYFVQDNGVGFEPASAARLFGMFQRLHSGEEFPGSGVGLASVKRIVGKHGGTVRATGSPGAGATFTFTLPSP